MLKSLILAISVFMLFTTISSVEAREYNYSRKAVNEKLLQKRYSTNQRKELSKKELSKHTVQALFALQDQTAKARGVKINYLKKLDAIITHPQIKEAARKALKIGLSGKKVPYHPINSNVSQDQFNEMVADPQLREAIKAAMAIGQ